jgi:hypothetical protein
MPPSPGGDHVAVADRLARLGDDFLARPSRRDRDRGIALRELVAQSHRAFARRDERSIAHRRSQLGLHLGARLRFRDDARDSAAGRARSSSGRLSPPARNVASADGFLQFGLSLAHASSELRRGRQTRSLQAAATLAVAGEFHVGSLGVDGSLARPRRPRASST